MSFFSIIRTKFVLCAGMLSMAIPLFADIFLDPEKTIIRFVPEHRKAAAHLAEHLNLITGKKFKENPRTEESPDQFVIYVGKQPPDKNASALLPEEGRWHFTQQAAYFYGNGTKGLRNAVFDFLENELGVRWPGGKEIAVRKRCPVTVQNLSGAWHPVLLLRQIRAYQDDGMNIWTARMRAGGHNIPPYGHAFIYWWDRFGKIHPEYFALNKGRRFPIAPDGSRKDDITISSGPYSRAIALCVSNDAVIKQIIKDWDKKSDFINICENDAPASLSCHCEKCIEIDPKHSRNLNNDMGADRYISFANKIVVEAKKLRTNVQVTMYAYNASEQPSVNVKVAPEVMLGIVPQDFRLASIKGYVNRWKAVGMKNFFYRPNRHHYYSPMGFPLGNEKLCFDTFQFLYASGAVAFDYDAPAEFDVFRWHNDYILFHAMNYPDRPFEYWEKHYGAAYGDACDEIIAYFRYWRNVWDERIYPKLGELATRKNWAYFTPSFFQRITEFYTPEDFKRSGALLENALQKTLSPDDRRRVNEVKVFHDHAVLMLTAARDKTTASSLAVVEFRKKHGMSPVMPYDNFKDICGVKALSELSKFAPPYIETPLFWHFRLDLAEEGEEKHWFATRDFLEWDGLMPTDSPWEKASKKYPHPSTELRRQTAEYDGVAWYACEVKVPAEWKGKRKIFVLFGAVDESAEVWLNGKKAGSHPFVNPNDWQDPFSMEITDLVDWSAEKQLLSVKVTDNKGTGGIWKRVFIASLEK